MGFVHLMLGAAALNASLACGGIHASDSAGPSWIDANADQTFEKVVSGNHNHNHNNNNNNSSQSHSVSRASMLA